MYTQFLNQPQISDMYKHDLDTSNHTRVLSASCFLANKEYDIPTSLYTLATFDLVENILKSKVLTYAIAFAGGAANGGILYFEARRDLLTWRAIYDGARFVHGVLV